MDIEPHSSMRCIDWERGTPYTYTLDDYKMLMASDKLFARKFDENTDFQICEKIRDHLLAKSNSSRGTT